MAHQLSWDLHVHPGPASVPRWGSGEAVRDAAERAGLRGFVWKSHEQHTATSAGRLPQTPPLAIGSASLNDWASPRDVWQAIGDGARWIWGPSRLPGLRLGWDLDLPAWWSDLLDGLPATPTPLVFATSHVGTRGRRTVAEAAARRGDICTVTHALYVPPGEISALVALGCWFEIDLYTSEHAIPGRPTISLAEGLTRLRNAGASVYLTSDAGQLATGDPYAFTARALTALADEVGSDVVTDVAFTMPDAVARSVGLGSA